MKATILIEGDKSLVRLFSDKISELSEDGGYFDLSLTYMEEEGYEDSQDETGAKKNEENE